LFAYRFLARVGGWWVDNDVVCNSDHVPDVEIAFAEEQPGMINNAVLKFPPNHAAICDLLEYVASVDPVTSAWGSTGPQAVTTVFRRHDLDIHQRPTSECYPLHWKEAPKFLFPEFTKEVIDRTGGSPFIHLWGSALREVQFDFKHSRPLEGSYLDLLYTRHLDASIADQLRPLDENGFRRSVQDYVAEHWKVSLSLV
jgi:hypothetical protein